MLFTSFDVRKVLITTNTARYTVSQLTVAVPEQVLVQQLGEETVLLNLETEEYYSLNPSGSSLWQLLAENALSNKVFEFEQVIQQLTALYHDALSIEQLTQEMQALVDELVQEGLLIVSIIN